MTYDVIVVGGGHNGLVCAAYLARSGKRVLVLEERPVVGGFCTTAETVAEAPGFKVNAGAFDHVLTNISPSVIDELDLAGHGLRFVAPDLMYSWLHRDGGAIRFWRQKERTVDDIRYFSPKDAARYERLVEVMRDVWWALVPYLQGHPKKIGGRTLGQILWRVAKGRRSLATGARILLSSPGAVIEEWFERPEVQAALANFTVGGNAPIDQPGSGFVLSLMALMHTWGVRRAVGGNGSFTQALAAAVMAHGGEVRTGQRVERILVDGNRAGGVVTASGERLMARQVVAAVDPMTLCRRLVGDEHLPETLRDELRGLGVHRTNLSAFKGDVVLSARPQLAGHEPHAPLLGSVMMFAPTLEAVRQSTRAMSQGVLDEDVTVWLSVPSVVDRALVPEGQDGESMYVYLPSVPYELTGAGDWAAEKDKVLERALDVFEDFAPGTKDLVVGTHATSPRDLAGQSDVYKASLWHVDVSLDQFGPWRPTPNLSGYRTPWEGLWHTGAGAHPVPLLNGWSGRTTAREVLRTLDAAP